MYMSHMYYLYTCLQFVGDDIPVGDHRNFLPGSKKQLGSMDIHPPMFTQNQQWLGMDHDMGMDK